MNAGLLRTVARRLRGHSAEDHADAELLGRFIREHDEPAFEELVRRHGPLVWGACRRTLANRADVEDAFQATFLVLAKNARTVRKPAALGFWLYGVARRVAYRMRSRAATTALSAEPAVETAESVTVREFLSALDDELARLPDRLRGPLVLCFLQERTQDEAARQLGISLSTLKRRLDRGRETLRERLARRGVDLTAALAATALAGGTTASATVMDAAAKAVLGGTASAGAIILAEGVVQTMTHAKLKVWAAGLLLVATAAGGTGYMALAGGQTEGGPGGRPAAIPGPQVKSGPTIPGGDASQAPPQKVDVKLLELDLELAKAELTGAEATLTVKAKQYEALPRRSTSQVELSSFEAELVRARVEVQKAQLRVQAAKHKLAMVKETAGQTAPQQPKTPASADIRKLREEMLKAAREAYRLDQLIRKEVGIPRSEAIELERVYRYSKRILEIENQLNPEDRLKATREHRDRMKELYSYATAAAEGGLVRPQHKLEAQVFLLEAEVWVKEAEAAATGR